MFSFAWDINMAPINVQCLVYIIDHSLESKAGLVLSQSIDVMIRRQRGANLKEVVRKHNYTLSNMHYWFTKTMYTRNFSPSFTTPLVQWTQHNSFQYSGGPKMGSIM